MSYPNTPPPVPGNTGYGYQAYEEPPRVSGVAVSALVCSLVVCVPFLTSLVAILLGAIGIAVTSSPKRKGRGLAIAGILIGLLGTIGWSYVTYQGYTTFVRPAKDGVAFLQALEDGDTVEAAKYTAPPFDPTTLPQIATQVKGWGKFIDINKRNTKAANSTTNAAGEKVFAAVGTARFENGPMGFDVEFTQKPEGWRITRLKLSGTPGPSNSPATMPSAVPSAPPSVPAVPTPPPAPTAP